MAEALAHGIEVIPTGAALGAEIRGLDVRAVDRETFEAIRTVWHRHLVVVLEDAVPIGLEDPAHLSDPRVVHRPAVDVDDPLDVADTGLGFGRDALDAS